MFKYLLLNMAMEEKYLEEKNYLFNKCYILWDRFYLYKLNIIKSKYMILDHLQKYIWMDKINDMLIQR